VEVISVSEHERRQSGRVPDAGFLPASALPMAEIVARYEGEWILVRVTEHDEDHWPAAGQILVHALRQQDVVRMLAPREPWSTNSPTAPNQPLFMFRAVPGFTPGNDVDAILEQLPFDAPEPL
jgi:hypothetical protein